MTRGTDGYLRPRRTINQWQGLVDKVPSHSECGLPPAPEEMIWSIWEGPEEVQDEAETLCK